MYLKTGTKEASSVEETGLGSPIDYPETADIDTASEAYARRFSGKVGAWFLTVQEEATLNMLRPYTGASILDIGGGHGQIVGALIRNKHKATVFGSSERCQDRITKFIDGGLCSFKTGNILDLPYPDRYFDVVVSLRLLPHVKHWKPFLAEAARVANRAVIIDYPELRSVNYFAPSFFNLKKGLERCSLTRPYSCFNGDDIVHVFKRNGFTQTERYAEFFLPMVFHRILKSPTMSIFLENIFRSTGLTGKYGSPVILKLTRDETELRRNRR